jgi:hypothetical protein
MTGKVLARPLRWGADKLAKRPNLNEAERNRLRITTIGACDLTKAERIKRRLALKYLRKKARRRATGCKSRADYEAKSISRGTDRLGMEHRPPRARPGMAAALRRRSGRQTS